MIKINMNYDLITCPIKRPNIIIENYFSFHHRRIVLYDSWETVMQMNPVKSRDNPQLADNEHSTAQRFRCLRLYCSAAVISLRVLRASAPKYRGILNTTSTCQVLRFSYSHYGFIHIHTGHAYSKTNIMVLTYIQ